MMIKALSIMGLLAFSLSAFAHNIQVFTIQSYPVSKDGMRVQQYCVLGDYQQALQAIKEKEVTALREGGVDAFKQAIKPLSQKLSQLITCASQAYSLGVKSLPAIVFDHHYVVYGDQSVGAANLHLNDYFKEQE